MSTTIGTAVRARLTTMIKKRLDVVLQRYSLDGSAFYFYRRFGSRRRQVGRTQRMMMRCDWTACAVRSVVYRTFLGLLGLVSVGLLRLVSVGLLGLDARGRAPLQRATPRGKVVGASSRSRGGVGARAAGGWALRLLGEGLSQGGLGREGQRGDCEDRDEDAGTIHGDDVVCVRAGTVRVRLVVMTVGVGRAVRLCGSPLFESRFCVCPPFTVSEALHSPSAREGSSRRALLARRRAILESVKGPRFCAYSGHAD